MPKAQLRAELSICDWIRGLAEIPADEFDQDHVPRYIFEHAIERSSLEPFIFFSSRHYTRNLVFKNNVFECLVICWDIGQSSAIHDHNDKSGWICLVDGRLFVQNYAVEARDIVHRTCCLIPTGAVELAGDRPTFIEKEQNVHKVSNLARYARRAISVHVYQQPMSQCEIYCPGTGPYEVVQMSYTSEFGRLSSGVML